MQHKKEWHEVNGDQHQGKDGHKIAVRLNLECVPRRRRQETEPKGINETGSCIMAYQYGA